MTHVKIESVGTAEWWAIGRPDRGNALGPTVAHELRTALDRLEEAAAKPRALVLTAIPVVKGGRRTWIAGGDLKELQALTSKAEGELYALSLSSLLSRLDLLPLPVLVAVDGDAIGGGAEVALGGDIRLATRNSRLMFRQLAVGLATGYGGARRLVELVGLSRAQGLLFGGEAISAEEALAMGLIHEVVPDAAALKTCIDARVQALSALEPAAIATQKAMFWHAVHSHPGAARAAELALFRDLWGNRAHRRYLSEFVAKSTGGS